jgi:Zn2+/Cd2+-exporting ATPase
MAEVIFKVEGLDCAEEVALLKKVVGGAQGVDDLDCNILQAKMVVLYDPRLITPSEIKALVRTTGMRALPWHEGGRGEKKALFYRHGRAILTLLSGLFLLIAAVLHYAYPHPILIKVLLVLSILCGVWYVLPKAFFSLRHLIFDINLLMVIAIIGSMAIEEWFEGSAIAFLFSLSLLLEQWSVGRARRALTALMDLSPVKANIIDLKTGEIEERGVKSVPVGTLILVRPGEKVPLDGIIVQGSSSLDQSPITGESIPILKEVGDEIFAGTLNAEGALQCRTTKPASETTLARIIQLVEEARTKRSESEQWVETFARYYTPIMLIFSILVMIVPPLFFAAPWIGWIYRGLVLLVIACPCALVISTPVSIICGLTSAARAGVLLKGGIFLEEVGKLKALAIDKTGTLTCGHPQVQTIVPMAGHTVQELMESAVALERGSEHPLARAIVRKGVEMGIQAAMATHFQSIKGKGALATYQERLFWIGSHRFMHEMGQESEEIHDRALALEDEGHSVVALGNETHVCGLISIADSPRQLIHETIAAIKSVGVEEIVMLTGDNEPTARALAAHTGVDRFYAELLPEEKVEEVLSLVRRWGKVGMVGDGVNDAPAMAAASVGFAMGGMGTHAAIETADVVLMSDDLSHLPWLIRHSIKVVQIIKQNIAFALGVKALFIALALLNRATLWMAIAADTGATLLVIFNALRLLRVKKRS